MYWGLLSLFAGLPADLREGSNDLDIYRETGEALLRGKVPYRDFFLEYPPGSLPAFLPPALLSEDEPGFMSLFTSEMALVLVAALVLTALAARRLRGPDGRKPGRSDGRRSNGRRPGAPAVRRAPRSRAQRREGPRRTGSVRRRRRVR